MCKVWVVDDDPTVADLFCKLLTDTGMAAEVVHNRDALDRLHSPATEMPAVVVLDLLMPSPDGNSILRALKLKSDAPPVILVTAYRDELADDVKIVPTMILDKPLSSPDVLLDAVWAAMTRPPQLIPQPA